MKDQVLQNAMSYTIFFYFASFKPFLCENERFSNLGNFVLVGNKCHIVWKIQISIVINKLKMSADNFVCPARNTRLGEDTRPRSGMPPLKKLIALVFQNADFYYSMQSGFCNSFHTDSKLKK
jgi:hypothetical protein